MDKVLVNKEADVGDVRDTDKGREGSEALVLGIMQGGGALDRFGDHRCP